MKNTNKGAEYETDFPLNRKQLRERSQAGERFEFYLFYGHRQKSAEVDGSCFSQWFERDFNIDGVEYSTAEHWMMAEKARLFEDSLMLQSILDSPGPREAKAFGRKVQGFDQSIWEQHRFEIVRRGNHAKFSQNEDLKQYLLATSVWDTHQYGMVAEPKSPYLLDDSKDDESAVSLKVFDGGSPGSQKASADSNNPKVILVEAAGRDVIWGIGLGQNNPKSRDPFQWRGQNLLGFALTVVREQLLSENE